MKELQAEPGNRIALMHGLAAVSLEAFKQIVGEQLDQQIQFVGIKIACRDAIDGESVFGFLDVILRMNDSCSTSVVFFGQSFKLIFKRRKNSVSNYTFISLNNNPV